MEVIDRLTAVFAIVDDDSVAVFETFLFRSFSCYNHQMAQKCLMPIFSKNKLGEAISILRNNQEMSFGNWCHISKGHTCTIFIYDICWNLLRNDFVKDGYLFG